MNSANPGLDSSSPASALGRRLLGLLLAASLIALAGAFVLESHFGIVGCVLCVYQRVPFAVAAICAAAGIAVGRSAALQRLALILCGIAFVVGTGLAFYQVGLQQRWWMDAGVCTGSAPIASSAFDLRAAVLSEAGRPPCDQVDWTLFGVSLAAWNAAVSLGLALLCTVGLVLTVTRRPPESERNGTDVV
ncbi:MAG: disulfide bond formation protein B [Rhodospirillales bacterium]|nr:disulfide bond formation protein B [Rhodospirillales bacterium]